MITSTTTARRGRGSGAGAGRVGNGARSAAVKARGEREASRTKDGRDVDPIKLLDAMLQAGHSLILFPEGTRGVPGLMADFKRGVGHLASRHPGIPVIPVYLDGLYRNLPKGRTMIVPFGGTLVLGEALYFKDESINEITDATQRAIEKMARDIKNENKLPHSKR